MNFYEQKPADSAPEKIKDKPEDFRYKLGRMMAEIAEGANAEFGENVLNLDGSINMRQ
ncbi:MAG TPA: hypothetical protein VMC41_04450 [Candidatus Nanoarchaeia archaeon]|nr:hypothetical protein [Candidatus Nanoarchaeia archaeon]